MKFHSPQNIFGASQQNSIVATTEVDGTFFKGAL